MAESKPQYQYVRVWFKTKIIPNGKGENVDYFETTALNAAFQGAALCVLDRRGVNHFFIIDSLAYFTVEPSSVVTH